MKWIQRIFSFIIMGVVAYVFYMLAVLHNAVDPAVIATLSFVFSVCVYFIGRADLHEEQNKHQSDARSSNLSSRSHLSSQPTDHGSDSCDDSKKCEDIPKVP